MLHRLPCKNEPYEFRFKDNKAEYLVRFKQHVGHLSAMVFEGDAPIGYRPDFMGSMARWCAKYILEQTLKEQQ